MLNNESPARTVADSITKDGDMPVSQHSSELHVSGSLFFLSFLLSCPNKLYC